MWLVEIPALMGKDFGKVRLTPSNSLGSSLHKAKWQDIRKKVGDYKAAQPDGREEELSDVERPTVAMRTTVCKVQTKPRLSVKRKAMTVTSRELTSTLSLLWSTTKDVPSVDYWYRFDVIDYWYRLMVS